MYSSSRSAASNESVARRAARSSATQPMYREKRATRASSLVTPCVGRERSFFSSHCEARRAGVKCSKSKYSRDEIDRAFYSTECVAPI